MLRTVLPCCVTMLGLMLLLTGVQSGVGESLTDMRLEAYSGGL